MFKLMAKKIMTILRSQHLLNLTYGIIALDKAYKQQVGQHSRLWYLSHHQIPLLFAACIHKVWK